MGRVVLDGPGDSQDVYAQMLILEGGYFASATKDLVRPVGFHMHGYIPFDLELKGRSGAIIDVGTIHLKPVPKDELLTLKGRIELEGQDSVDHVKMRLSIKRAENNTPHNGSSPRPRWPAPIMADIQNNGKVSAEGLTPYAYNCFIRADGFISQSRTIEFKRGEDYDLGTIRLERSCQISLTYVVADKPPFDLARKQVEVLPGGARWKAVPKKYGWDLEFSQKDGAFFFNYSYSPCYIMDLGEGSIEDFLERASEENPNIDPRNLKVEDHHVYLLNQAHFKRWILFEVRTKQD